MTALCCTVQRRTGPTFTPIDCRAPPEQRFAGAQVSLVSCGTQRTGMHAVHSIGVIDVATVQHAQRIVSVTVARSGDELGGCKVPLQSYIVNPLSRGEAKAGWP